MTLARVIVQEVNRTKVHTYYPLSVSVKNEGSKKPDTFIGTFKRGNIVKNGNEVRYINDVADVEALRVIYNFQLSALDEGGYDIDPDVDPISSRFEEVTTGKYMGHYALDFDASGDGVIFSNSADLENKIDLSKQFDIFVSFTPDRTQLNDGSDEPILWSWFDSPTGLEIGISGDNGDDDSWRGFARIGNGSLVSTITGQNQLIMRDTSGDFNPILIRVYRGQDNIIRMEINGEEDVTVSESASLQPSGADMIFGDGNPVEVSKEYLGLIHQVRVYSGDTVKSQQANFIRWAKPITHSTEFRGLIWTKKDNATSTTVKAQSHSRILLTGDLSSEDSSPFDPTSFDLNGLGTEGFADIVQDVLDSFPVSGLDFTNFTIKHVDAFEEQTTVALQGNIYQTGSFMDFINILLEFSDTVFYITTRNILIVETNAGKQTNYVFEQNNPEGTVAAPYNITVDELNDEVTINEVILNGSDHLFPNASEINTYTLASTNDIKRTLRQNIMQLDSSIDFDSLGSKIVQLRQTTNKQFKIKITSALHSVRFNQKVNIINSDKNIDEDTIITQVTKSHPSQHTLINTGENDIEYYDNIQKTIVQSQTLFDRTQIIDKPT